MERHCVPKGGIVSSPLLLPLLAVLLLASASTGSHADGLHARALDGDDLELAWRKLVRKTWPDRIEAPKISIHASRPLIVQAIHELISVLQFVDPYNYADDSPAWMATEELRTKSKEQASRILVELGRGAAPYVWQAIELETRFAKPQFPPEDVVKAYREAQVKYKSALEALEGERRQDKEYARLSEAHNRLRPIVNILKYLEKAERELRLERVAARGKDEAELKRVEAEYAAVEARQKALGNLSELSKKLDELKAQIATRAEIVDQEPKVAELKAAAETAQKKLQELSRTSGNLGQGLDPAKIGGDSAMVTSELYSNDLISTLMDMGPEALPEVKKGMKKRAMVQTALALQQHWVQERWAKPFAIVAFTDRTNVALAAEDFLKSEFKEKAIKPLIEALPKAKPDELPCLYKALRLVSGRELPDEIKPWTDLLAPEKGSKGTKAVRKGVPDEEED